VSTAVIVLRVIQVEDLAILALMRVETLTVAGGVPQKPANVA